MNFSEHRTMLKELSSRAFNIKCFWSGKEEITAFHIHILYFDWLQTNLRESPEYQLVCAWELTLEYAIRRVCHLIKPLLTPPQPWWNLNCFFPLSLPLWEAQPVITSSLLMTDGPAGWPRGQGRDGLTAEHRHRPAGTPSLYHWQQQPTFISSYPQGFNIIMQRKSLLVLHWPHSLMLLLWAIWTRAGEVVWKGSRHSGKREASCFDWCNHHRLLHW